MNPVLQRCQLDLLPLSHMQNGMLKWAESVPLGFAPDVPIIVCSSSCNRGPELRLSFRPQEERTNSRAGRPFLVDCADSRHTEQSG